jgi:hypothetical protein
LKAVGDAMVQLLEITVAALKLLAQVGDDIVLRGPVFHQAAPIRIVRTQCVAPGLVQRICRR